MSKLFDILYDYTPFRGEREHGIGRDFPFPRMRAPAEHRERVLFYLCAAKMAPDSLKMRLYDACIEHIESANVRKTESMTTDKMRKNPRFCTLVGSTTE